MLYEKKSLAKRLALTKGDPRAVDVIDDLDKNGEKTGKKRKTGKKAENWAENFLEFDVGHAVTLDFPLPLTASTVERICYVFSFRLSNRTSSSFIGAGKCAAVR